MSQYRKPICNHIATPEDRDPSPTALCEICIEPSAELLPAEVQLQRDAEVEDAPTQVLQVCSGCLHRLKKNLNQTYLLV